jgi:hypothetical protein
VDGKLARSGEEAAAGGEDAGSKVVSFAKAP